MTLEATALNDVDLVTVGGLAQAIQVDPERGATVWSASVTWKGAFRSEAQVRDFEPIPSDEPIGLGGTDTAPNPVEQLLGALGNCLAVGYAAIDVKVHLDADADPEQLQALHEAVVGTSPVGHTLQAAIPVSFQLA